MASEIKELTARNRRQEDFIFTMQTKLDQALKQVASLELTIAKINEEKIEPL